MFVSIISDEFIDNLPPKFKKKIEVPNVILNSKRKIEIRKPVPISVMISVLKKMETVILD